MMNEKRLRIRLLLILALFEACLVARVWHVEARPAKAAVGFLIKSGNKFSVAWKQKNQDFEIRDYVRLQDALAYAHQELGLSEGINPFGEYELERVWKDSRFGNTVVLWKAIRQNHLNQITFQDENEANYFMNAFQHGSYAPSMFGHSVLLVPQKSARN
jgi:hypothetical protein